MQNSAAEWSIHFPKQPRINQSKLLDPAPLPAVTFDAVHAIICLSSQRPSKKSSHLHGVRHEVCLTASNGTATFHQAARSSSPRSFHPGSRDRRGRSEDSIRSGSSQLPKSMAGQDHMHPCHLKNLCAGRLQQNVTSCATRAAYMPCLRNAA